MVSRMDVKTKPLFYRTALIICYLFCFLQVSPALSATEKQNVLHPQGLLWKIQKAGHADSYLFGTIHIGDNRVIELLDIVQKPLKASDVFAMEVVLDENAQAVIAQAGLFENGELLQDYVDDLQLDRINRIMYQYYGVTPASVNKMKPWVVMATISSPPPESNKTVLDIQLQSLAEEAQRSVIGLETIEEQVDVLSGMVLSEQLWLLNKAVNDFEETTNLWESMIVKYLRGDLQALMQEQDAMMDDSTTIDDRFIERLLDQRNVKMAQRLVVIMQNKTVFAAIGALHLPGEKGVLHLLEKAGYQVSPIF